MVRERERERERERVKEGWDWEDSCRLDFLRKFILMKTTYTVISYL